MLEKNEEIVDYSFEPTPNGGIRAEAHYLNFNHEYVAKDIADIIIIKEFDRDGTIIMETILTKGEEQEKEEESPRKSR